MSIEKMEKRKRRSFTPEYKQRTVDLVLKHGLFVAQVARDLGISWRSLSRWLAEHGAPEAITVDNGSEFTSRHFDAWACENGISIDFMHPGRPAENGLCESFNGKLRDECMNASWFRTLAEARTVIEQWRKDYNELRPHSALGNPTPNEYVRRLLRWKGVEETVSLRASS